MKYRAKHKKLETHKIPRRRYFVITASILVLFVFLELFSNLNYLVNTNVEENTKITNIEYNDLIDKAHELEEISYYSDNGPEFIILDSKEDSNVSKYVKEQIETLKINYKVVNSFENLSEEVKSELKLVLVCKKDISSNEIAFMKDLLSDGVNLLFVTMPHEEVLENKELQDIMGIRELEGIENHDGIRFVSNFFLSDIALDLKTIPLDYTDVKLKQGSKTFAYALLADVEGNDLKNEESPPLIWRYIYDNGEVYTINADLILLAGGKGLITSILSKMEDVFVYPVINAYCVVISGLPFLSEINHDFMKEKYSRTALQFQQDVLFPAISSSCAKYNYIPTYILNTGQVTEGEINNENALLSYYHKEIIEQAGEIGLYYQDGVQNAKSNDYLSEELPKTIYLQNEDIEVDYSGLLSSCEAVIENWGENFYFSPLNEKVTSIPVTVSGLLPDDITTLKEKLYVTSLGILVVDISINSVIDPTMEEHDWISYSKEYETVLGVHARELYYLDRLSASDVAKRIKSYQLAVPNISYNESNCVIEIDNFVEESYFILRTNKVLTGIENGEYSVISDDAYMIKATESVVTISYTKEAGALK